MRFLPFIVLALAACVSDVVPPPDGGTPTDGPSTDSSGGPCRAIPNGMGVQCGAIACPGPPNLTPRCCVGDQGNHTCVGLMDQCGTAMVWGCDKSADCANQSCCATNPGTSGACPLVVTLPAMGKNTHCAVNCMANEVRLCATNADCAGEATKKTCTPAVFDGDPSKTVGICR